MHAPRRSWSLASIALPVLLCGCASQTPTQPAAAIVHVVNRMSNVIVTSVDLHGSVLGTPPNDGYGYLASCGGEAEMQVPIRQGSGGRMALAIDSSGVLDQVYPQGGLESSDATRFSLLFIWSDGALGSGDWVVAAPDGVTKSATPPASMPSGACGTWIGGPEPS